MAPLQGDDNKAIVSNTNYQMEVSTMYLLFHRPSREKRKENRKKEGI